MADTVTMPKLGFDMAEGTLVRWVKKDGETVNKGDILAEIETDKATVEVESSFSGVIHSRLVEEGSVVPVGTPIAIIAAPGEKVTEPLGEKPTDAVLPQKSSFVSTEPIPSEPVLESEDERVKASPLARRMARENGLSLERVSGTGPGGRVIKRDIEKALTGNALSKQSQDTSLVKKPSLVPTIPPVNNWDVAGKPRGDVYIPLTRLRSVIARRMVESKQAPHFYVTHDFDMGALMALRKDVNEFLVEDERLSVNDFIVKGTALALRQFPNINASFSGEEIIQRGGINIGVAVALEKGLMTVVCRDVDLKPIRVISTEIKEMAARARAGRVKPDDIEGSTFSISNLGMFDVENFAAIINSPEGAILAVASVKQVPVVQDGALVIGTRMKATLSADHRVTDGAEAARFMQTLAQYLEKPASILI